MEKSIDSFEALTHRLREHPDRKRVAVVCPHGESTLAAVKQAEEEGFITPLFVDDADPQAASHRGVELVRQGEADILMKGLVQTADLLRAVLDKKTGILPPGGTLTHIAVAQIPTYHKLLFYSDAAVIPYPTASQRREQVKYMVGLCHRLGIGQPKISLIHCSEKADAKNFPFTEDYLQIVDEARHGAFGSCVVDGPLDVKTSCDLHSMEIKGIRSPIAGDADGLILPDIEAGNLFYKTVTLFAGAEVAGMLQGTLKPVVLPSRGDNHRAKYLSLLLAAIAG